MANIKDTVCEDLCVMALLLEVLGTNLLLSLLRERV